MNVLIILAAPTVEPEAIRYWKARLTQQDRLYMLSLRGPKTEHIDGFDIHHVDVDPAKPRAWRSRAVRTAGRQLRFIHPFWDLILFDLWPDLLWNIRCFDPDVIDLRWLRGARTLRRKLSNQNWRVVLSEKDIPAQGRVSSSWRCYDPDVKVSIVLPVYNGERYLRQSIESCLQQTHRNIELVIVDDCSTDQSPLIIAECAGRDARIISIRNRHNMRLPGALNVGFAATTGELLTWTSHDNYYAPRALEALVRYLCTRRDVDLVYSALRIIDANGEVEGNVNYLKPPWMLPFENVVLAYFLFRRSVYDEVGDYHADMEYAEDYDYWIRAYKKGFKMMRLHDPLYYYRHHNESMTTRAKQMEEKPWAKVARKHYRTVTP